MASLQSGRVEHSETNKSTVRIIASCSGQEHRAAMEEVSQSHPASYLYLNTHVGKHLDCQSKHVSI